MNVYVATYFCISLQADCTVARLTCFYFDCFFVSFLPGLLASRTSSVIFRVLCLLCVSLVITEDGDLEELIEYIYTQERYYTYEDKTEYVYASLI